MGEIMMGNWDIREFRVRVNLPSVIWQVWVPIQWVLNLIWGHPNPIREVIPLKFHIRLYSPYCSYLPPPSLFLVNNSTIIAEHKVNSSLSISPCHHHNLTLSTVYTKYSTHQLQHTPNTAYTRYSIHPGLSVFPSISQLQVDPWMFLCLL